ncbi:MAG: small multi-drug export protein [Clostridia bacterium]|nr:small multi-drug export protein [Clostridia bacterium]
MTEFVEGIFSNIFGSNVVLATILIAMVPVIELKGAIPFSMAVDIWGINALSFFPALIYGILGSSLIVPILALIYKPVINWLKKTKLFRRIAEKIENRINAKKINIDSKIEKQQESLNQEGLELENYKSKKERKKFLIKFFSVFVFVAIPLPLTGVWTGTCLAVVLGLNFWQTCLCVIPANIVAGLIIALVSLLFGESTWIFVLILLAIILLIALAYVIKKIFKKIYIHKNQNK